ncbi:hypothetical protein ACOJ3U_001710 [Campylobacter jejuni]|nr:hypothetical protein [Campylobacter jejuni]EAI2123877.1 hypothetical protein [Campylobacter jejuni]EFV4202830.1 hypothetical protein [Campylobacter jejuni]EJD0663693.1 hypothetical protein [Campylobacter jejuni]EJD0663892.1 hypothetical protein [Campylobacter jejuni]
MSNQKSDYNGILNLAMESYSADTFKQVAIQFKKDKEEYLKKTQDNKNNEKNNISVSHLQKAK